MRGYKIKREGDVHSAIHNSAMTLKNASKTLTALGSLFWGYQDADEQAEQAHALLAIVNAALIETENELLRWIERTPDALPTLEAIDDGSVIGGDEGDIPF